MNTTVSTNKINGRTRDVEIGAVDVLARGKIFCLTCVGAVGVAAPVLVDPGKQDNAQLLHDIGIGHVEVRLDACAGEDAAPLQRK
jgi:hypothetical protein